jgi:hypothetical protein
MSVRERVRGWMPVLVAGGLLAAGGVVAIPLGGWDTVELQSAVLPEHPVGEPYAGHRVSTSIDEIWLTDTHPDGYTEAEPGTRFLIVEATVENLTAEPQAPLGSASFWAFTLPGVVEPGVLIPSGTQWSQLVRDGSTGSSLNPGVPETVQFIFMIDDDLYEAGDEVRVGLTDATPEDADLFDGTRWARPHVAVEVPIVIGEQP